MKKSFWSVLFLFFLMAAFVHGQGFTGPSSNNNRQARSEGRAVTVSEPITVSEARNLPKDSWVILNGNIVNALPGGKLYTFRDPSGEIIVEIDLKIWRGLSAGVSENVQISGEIERERGRVIIEVKAISGSGSTNIRSGQAVTLTQPSAIREVSDLPNNSWVILSGNIVRALRGESYTFRDSSNEEIIVQIERKVWRGLSAGESDRVEICGVLKIKRRQVSVEVKAIRKIPHAEAQSSQRTQENMRNPIFLCDLRVLCVRYS